MRMMSATPHRMSNLTPSELARAVGINKGHASMLLSGLRRPSWVLACRISDAFGVSLDELRKALPATQAKAA